MRNQGTYSGNSLFIFLFFYTNTILEKRDYVGTSKGMEEEGVSRICKAILEDKYVMHKVSHDNDVSSMSQIHKAFLECIEQLDVGHAAKNIAKKVILFSLSLFFSK